MIHVPCLDPAPAQHLCWGEGIQGADGWGGKGKARGAVAQNSPVNPQRTTLLTPWESPTRNRLLTGSWKCFLWHVLIQAGDSPVGTLGQILDRIPECPKQAQGFLDNKPGRMHEQMGAA